MDTIPTNASASPGSRLPKASFFSRFFTVLISGLIVGVVLAAATIWIPSNRIVVFNQPYATYVTISSIRMARPGFLVLYNDKQGLQQETVYPLERGYYRNVSVPIDTEDIVTTGPYPIPFVVRLFVDDGDRVFNAQQDTPVSGLLGGVYSKRFWMEYAATPGKHLLNVLTSEPLIYLWNVLFP